MTLLDRVKLLAAKQKISISELERKLDFSGGSISKWVTQSPSSERLQKVADYFNVTTDYLLGREVTHQDDDVQTFFRINMEEVPEDRKEEVLKAMEQYYRFLLRDMED